MYYILLLLNKSNKMTTEATSKSYFTPAGCNPDHVQKIRNGDSSTGGEILYADSRVLY